MHKLEKLILESYAQLLTEMDGGRLFDYFNSKGYDITERSSDGGKPGFEGYMVSKGESRSPQAVIFQHNKDTDEFTISRMSGYRIDQEEAMKAGMRRKSSSAVAGIDGYMTDGNYTPVSISAEDLKDIVDHVMTGLDREAEAQRDFYAKRGPVSGTIDEMSLKQIEKESGGRPTQWEDLTDAQRAGIVKRYGEPMFDGKHDFFGTGMETYFKATKKNDETGSITHKVIKLPSFASIYHNFSDIIADIKKLMGSDDVRKDERARELFDIVKTNFRKLQRYLRIERPEQYRMLKMQRMMEGVEHTMFQLAERMDINDPVLVRSRMAKMRADDLKKLDAYKKSPEGRAAARAQASAERKEEKAREVVRKLKIKRAQVMSDMENDPDIEPEGGPVADMYGDQLNKIDNAIEKAASVYNKPMDYDTAVGKVNEGVEKEMFTYLDDLRDSGITNMFGAAPYLAQAFDIDKRAAREVLSKWMKSFNESEEEETDYVKRRREEDDYYEDPDYYKEGKISLAESLLDDIKEEEEPEPEEEGDEEAPKDTVLEDATDQILSKFPTLKATIVKLQTEDFKEFVDSIDWISPRPTEFRINLKNGQDYILKWTGTGFEAQIMGKRYYIDKINDYQQALDKLAILYKEGPMSGAGEGEPADVDSGGSAGGGGGDFPGDDAGGGGLGDDDAGGLGGDDAGGLGDDDAGGGADLGGEPIDFEEPAEEPEA